MSKRFAHVLVVLMVLLLSRIVSAEELPFTHMTPEGRVPLTSGSVQKILQDHQGFLWFAFYSSGVARFDGHTLESFSIDEGLADVTVREMVEDAGGRLWIGSESGLVATTKRLDDYALDERIRFSADFGTESIAPNRTRRNCVVADRNGWVWQGTGGDGLKLYRIEGKGLQSRSMSTDVFGSGKNEPVTAMTLRRDGSVLVALSNGVFLSFTADGTQTIIDPQEDGGQRKTISAIHEGLSGALWIGGTDGTVTRYKPGKADAFTDMKSPLTERVASLVETSAAELWAVSVGSGVASFALNGARAPRHYRSDDGLLSNTFWHALEDRNGALWLGQNGGVSRLARDYAAIGRYTHRSLPEPSVFAIVPPYEAGAAGARVASSPVRCPGVAGAEAQPPLWLGTGGGVVALCGGSVAARLSTAEGIASNAIYSMSSDALGRLWIGTLQGLNCLSFDEFSKPPAGGASSRSLQLFGRQATLVTFSTDGSPIYAGRRLPIANAEGDAVESLWFTGSGGLWCYVGEQWYFFHQAAGLSGNGTTGVALDHQGYVWVGTADRGLLRSVRPMSVTELERLKNASTPADDLSLAGLLSSSIGEISVPAFEPIWNKAKGARTNSIRNLARQSDRMLVGTANGLGVLKEDGARLETLFGRDNGLGGDAIVGIAISPVDRRVWVSQNAGLAVLDAQMKSVVRLVTKREGLVDDEAWAYGSVSADADGVIYLGSPNGLSIVRAQLLDDRAAAPALRLKHAAFREFGAGKNELRVAYAALAFANDDRVRYKTRLSGYDSDWSEPTTEVSARYTNLAPGTYTFEVMATVDGGWTEPVRYRFTVQKR